MSSPSLVEIELAVRVPQQLSMTTSSVEAQQSIQEQTTAQTTFETQTNPGPEDRNISALAPVDGGLQAWSFLSGAFVIEVLVWGLPNSFGVFLNNYLQDNQFTSQKHASAILPLIGTLTSGIMFCTGPVIFPFISKYPKSRRTCLFTGLVFCWAGLFGASYATKIIHLLIFQGVFYGVGGSLLYAPIMSYLAEWFVRKRGLASGTLNAGTAVGGLVLPPLLPGLLEKYGRGLTLRILSFVTAFLIILVLPFLKPRLPEGQVRGPRPGSSRAHREDEASNAPSSIRGGLAGWLLVSDIPFQLSILATTVQALAYYLPVLYLPSFASSLGLSDSTASLTVALLNGSSLFSRITFGLLSDRLSPLMLGFLAAIGTSVATFVLWGVVAQQVASQLKGLIIFGLVYGASAGGWTSLFVGFVRRVANDDPSFATTLLSMLFFVQGCGNILSTPISTALLNNVTKAAALAQPSPPATAGRPSGVNSGSGYEKMILYVGSCFAGASAIAIIGVGVERSRHQQQRA